MHGSGFLARAITVQEAPPAGRAAITDCRGCLLGQDALCKRESWADKNYVYWIG